MLTIRQHATLDFIRAYHARHGFAPSLAEIALGLGLSSKGSIHRQVQSLAEAGYIRLIPGRKRGIELIEAEGTAATLPLLGRIAAGLPIEAIQGEDSLNLTEFLMGPGRFALRVQGDSMIEAGILDGDTVIIRRSDTAGNGDIVVALIDGEEATLKRLRHRPGGLVELIPANARFAPLLYPAARVQIQGVLVGQLRTYP
jgi:repressor LexA